MKISILHFCFLAIGFAGLTACEDKGKTENPAITPPVVVLDSIGGVFDRNAGLFGKVASSGSLAISARGAVFSETETAPTIRKSDGFRPGGVGAGSFRVNLTTLKNRTTYYMRVYAVNYLDTIYSNTITHFSAPKAPTLAAASSVQVDRESVVVKSTLTGNGSELLYDRGFLLSTKTNPTLATGTRLAFGSTPAEQTDSTRNEYQMTVTGLAPNTQYFLRPYARNRGGVGYGSQISVTTQP